MRVRLLVATALSVVALFSTAGLASAGQDNWGCLSTNGGLCWSGYLHHLWWVNANYAGTGSLPLLAGDYCWQAGCPGGNYNGWLFVAETGDPGVGYNDVGAGNYPGLNDSAYLGQGAIANLHSSSHNITGYEDF